MGSCRRSGARSRNASRACRSICARSANLPEKKRTQWALTKEEMRNCRWLKPELVVQIEFAEWTPDGHLRHSKFVGLREDKDPGEVTCEQ
jgi:ATP-dependent DNA ligase